MKEVYIMEMVKVDKRIARRLWDNGCKMAFYNGDRSALEYPYTREEVEERDFDKRYNTLLFYKQGSEPLQCYADKKDIENLKESALEDEKIRNEVRNKIENARQLLFGKRNGNECEVLLRHDGNATSVHFAVIKDKQVKIRYQFPDKKGTMHFDTTRVDNIISIRWDTLDKNNVFALTQGYNPETNTFGNGPVTRVSVVDLTRTGKFKDYDTGEVYSNSDLGKYLGWAIPDRQLHIKNQGERNVTYENGEVKEFFLSSFLEYKINEFRENGRLDKETELDLKEAVSQARSIFKKEGVEHSSKYFMNVVDEYCPHLKEEWKKAVEMSIMSVKNDERNLENTVDKMFNILDIKCNTPMRKAMRDTISDTMQDDLGEIRLSENLDNVIHDLQENGKSHAPGGMVYTSDVNKFFEKYKEELAKFAVGKYPDKDDPFFMGNINRTWVVNRAYNNFLNEIEEKAFNKEKEIDKLWPVCKTVDLTPDIKQKERNRSL